MLLLAVAFVGVQGVKAQADDDGDGGEELGSLIRHTHVLIGSTGIVDEEDRDKINFNGTRAILKQAAGNTSAVLRFSIQPHFLGTFTDVAQMELHVRFRDNGAGARVVARLKQMDTGFGTTTTLLTFDSNDFNQQTEMQRNSVYDLSGDFDYFPHIAYYVEVTLTRSSASGTPELGAIEVGILE
jgi:hypothetical protein